MISEKVKNTVVLVVSYLYVLLFVYAAVSKLLEFQNFQAQLSQSPLLSAYTGFISYVVLIVEFTIALVLAFPKTRYIGLLSSFALMIMFTGYIIIILNYSSFIPCSCGGVLEKMGWKEHLIFNSIFSLLAAIGCLFSATNRPKTIRRLTLITLCSSTILAVTFLYSEHTIHHENPFIRRFIQGTATKVAEIDLSNNSNYFAGASGNFIYLGDNAAPLHITAFDTTLKTKTHYKIQLEREDFPFKSVQVRVAPPYFYLLDGTVPVIYRGEIADWKSKLLMHDNNYYFSKAEIIEPNKIVFRAQQLGTLYNILGTFTFNDSLKVAYAPQLLQKQIDGFFDTDGMLQYDIQNKKVVYTYYYRNQFIIADKNLNVVYRGNTIDTITRAKIKVAHIKETGQRKIASLPATVNQIMAISNKQLFINSKIMGRYEPKEMWKKAAIVDIYNIENNSYVSSIYIYDVAQSKLKNMFVLDHNLYVLIGHHLHLYKLHITDKPTKK